MCEPEGDVDGAVGTVLVRGGRLVRVPLDGGGDGVVFSLPVGIVVGVAVGEPPVSVGDGERRLGALPVSGADVAGDVVGLRGVCLGAWWLAEIGRTRKYRTSTTTNSPDSTRVDGRAVTWAVYQARNRCGIRSPRPVSRCPRRGRR